MLALSSQAIAAEVLDLIDAAGIIIDVIGVAVILIGILWGLWLGARDRSHGTAPCEVYDRTRQRLGRSVVLGLEILVASDIIHTVAVEPTLGNAGVLAVLIVVRTFINWTMVVDLEGRWPWQPKAEQTAPIASNS